MWRPSASPGQEPRPGDPSGTRDWLQALRRYLVVGAFANLLWEFAHLPLYTIWESGSRFELAFAAIHCTGGDILIALSSVMLALFLAGGADWPAVGRMKVGGLTMAFGLSYTVFSEWLNVEIRGAWAYRDLMPVIPLIDAGLTPMLQWLVIPLVALWWAYKPAAAVSDRKRFKEIGDLA